MYLSFKYKEIESEGYGLEIIEENKSLYLFYIDKNILPRFTKLNHLKKLKDLKDKEINNEDVTKNLKKSQCNLNLFGYEARPFLEETRKKYKDVFDDFEEKRLDDDNFNLKKYSRK